MRVLAIGVGGAGSRIVDHLYDHDCRSKVCCMKALVIDLDPNSLQQLPHLPHASKLFFPPIDPHFPYDVEHAIHIEEVLTRIQQVDTIQIDAILLCAGLGGTLVNAIPRIASELRKSFIEPIFALCTLPCRLEGRKRAAKAYADLQLLLSVVDALILFDNELLFQKVESPSGSDKVSPTPPTDKNRSQGIPRNPRDIYAAMNERIARNVGLLLRAGEFNERGLEVAEVVLDAGEVLKTLTGMGIVAIGYAVDELEPASITSWLHRVGIKKPRLQTTHERAARIVSLAKRAVYEETSVSCDLTSAEKALVLIAGPSHELSMRGFQTVRKWIDRSISGLEMRSGDYPVKNTRFIGMIIALAGLKNVPRIEELRQLFDEVRVTEGEASMMLGKPIPEAILIPPPTAVLPSLTEQPAPSPAPALDAPHAVNAPSSPPEAKELSLPQEKEPEKKRSSRKREPQRVEPPTEPSTMPEEKVTKGKRKPRQKSTEGVPPRTGSNDFDITWFE